MSNYANNIIIFNIRLHNRGQSPSAFWNLDVNFWIKSVLETLETDVAIEVAFVKHHLKALNKLPI